MVQRRPGAPPRIERRASVIAIDFEPLPRARARAHRHDPDLLSQRADHPGRDRPRARHGRVARVRRRRGRARHGDDRGAAAGEPRRGARADRQPAAAARLCGRAGARRRAQDRRDQRRAEPVGAGRQAPRQRRAVTTLLRLETRERGRPRARCSRPTSGANSIADGVRAHQQPDPVRPGVAAAHAAHGDRGARRDRDRRAADLADARRAAPRRSPSQLLEIAGERDVPYVSSDERLNAVLLRVRPGETERVRALVDRLDRPARGAGGHPGAEAALCRPGGARRAARSRCATADAGDVRSDAAPCARGAARARVRGGRRRPHPLARAARGRPRRSTRCSTSSRELDRVPASVRVEITVASIDLDDRLDLGADYLIPLTDPKAARRHLIAGGARRIRAAAASRPVPSAERPFVASFTRAPLLVTFIDPTTGEPITIPIPRESASITLNGRTVKHGHADAPQPADHERRRARDLRGRQHPDSRRAAARTAGTEARGTVTQDPSLAIRRTSSARTSGRACA